MKLVITENVKRQPKPQKKAEAKKELGKKKQVENEVIQKVTKIRKERRAAKPKEVVVEKPKHTFKINERVRLIDSKSIGTIDVIEKGKATVNYGMFTTLVSLEQLEPVGK